MVKNSLKILGLLGLFLCSLSAYSQKVENLTITVERGSLPQILKQLEQDYPVRFFYPYDFEAELISKLDTGDYQLVSFLNQISSLTSSSYIIRDNYFVVFFKEENSEAPRSEKGQTFYTFGSAVLSDQDTVSLSGIIRDGQSEEELVGALVSNGFETTVSDYRGRYTLKMPTGYNRLTVRYVGFERLQLDVEIYNEAVLDVNLYESSVLLDEVVVTDKADDILQQTLTGVEKLTREDISKIPSVLGEQDVVKSLLSLPGVTTVGEAGGGFNVRGGNAGQNLVMIDDITIFNPVHLFGFLSTFNQGIVQDATLYRGGIPAQYGGWASSVLNTTTVSSLDSSYHLDAKAGIISSGISFRGPIVKEKVGVVASFRSAYPNWLLTNYPDPDVKRSDSFFSEYYVKGEYATDNKKHLFRLTSYRSFDRFSFGDQAEYEFTNSGFSGIWDNQISNDFSQGAIISYSAYDSETIGSSNGNTFALISKVEQQQSKYFFSTDVIENHSLTIGVDNILYWVNPGDLSSASGEELSFPREAAALSALYLEDRWDVFEDLQIIAGLRYTGYSLFGNNQVFGYQDGVERRIENTTDTTLLAGFSFQRAGLEPRISANFSIDNATSLKLSYQRSQQFLNRITNTVAISPIDTWKLSDPNTAPTLSDRIVLGLYRRLSKTGLDISVEGYYTRFENLLEYKNGSTVLLNPRVETELLQGEGLAYGVEVLVKKQMGDLNGWASYTFSRSLQQLDDPIPENQINNGELFPTNYDIPNTVNAFVNYDLSRVFDLSLSFTYSTGRPVTLPESFYQIDNIVVPNFDQRNNYRLPDYHRLDLSLNWDVSKLRRRKSFRSYWNFTIYNLYGRDNAFSQFVSPAEISNRPEILQLSVLPQPVVSVSYNLKLN